MRIVIDPDLPTTCVRYAGTNDRGQFKAGIVIRADVPQAERDRLIADWSAAVVRIEPLPSLYSTPNNPPEAVSY